MDWMKILAAVAGIMMLFYLWPAYKHWSANSPKAEKGDWQSLLLPLGGVALLILVLIMSVQN